MRRGYTLVELMFTVAMMGILVAGIDALALQTERTALTEVQRERARLLLGYHARQIAAGRPVVPAIEEQLTASLPGAKVLRERAGQAVTLRVSWTQPTGPASELSLTVLSGSAR